MIHETKTFTGKTPLPLPNPDGRVHWHPIKIDFPATALLLNDLIRLCELPAGTRCLDYVFHFNDIDSAGSPLLVFSIGTENAGGTDLGFTWEASILAGRALNPVRCNSVGGSVLDNITVNRTISMKVTAAAGTYTGAGKSGYVLMLLAD